MQTGGQNGANNWVLSLIISGESLDFAGIEETLALQPSDIRHKGEMLNRLPPIVSEQDVWIYELPLYDNEGLDPRMHDLLARLESLAGGLQVLRESGDVVLRLYVKSEYAQIFYRLMPDTLRRLAAFGLPLEVSVVSWGAMRFDPTE